MIEVRSHSQVLLRICDESSEPHRIEPGTAARTAALGEVEHRECALGAARADRVAGGRGAAKHGDCRARGGWAYSRSALARTLCRRGDWGDRTGPAPRWT